MGWKSAVRRSAWKLGYRIERLGDVAYDHDHMTIRARSIPFLKDARFLSAYKRGINSDHNTPHGGERDGKLHIEWRCAVTCWAAAHGAKLPGDFVECGVNTGVRSLAICEYLDFNSLDKSFYLFDTYCGIPIEQASEKERLYRKAYSEQFYPDCFEATKKNFAAFPRAKLIRGKVPDTLNSVEINRVCYLHIDMNIAYPERKAIEHFWPKLSCGAFVVLDDYAWWTFEEQMAAMDEFAKSVNVEILTLPTGQGLLIKP
jgi:O-methyltransferase